MTLEIGSGSTDTAGAPLLEYPVAIGNLFGWLYRGINERGVILCGTHGYEQHCAHRAWRSLAHRIAATGCTTLRFDYPGEGDSGGTQLENVKSCVDSIHQAAAYLRREMNVSEIVLVGLRLGGTFAALTAQEADISRLILIAPVISGRSYLREMKIQAQMFNLRPDGSPLPDEAGAFNVCGFYLNKEFFNDISMIDLRKARRSAPQLLLLGPDNERLATTLTALGSNVTILPFGELQQLVGNAVTSRLAGETASLISHYAAGDVRKCLSITSLPPQSVFIEGEKWRETPVRFGKNVFGILCRPIKRNSSFATTLFINMGANVHSGHGRQTTNLARKLAEIGASSLRMDLLGVGDSPDRDNSKAPFYNFEALEDVGSAINYLSSVDASPIVIAGTCNGAYLAFHATCRDVRIRGAVIANLYCFDWDLAHDGIPFSEKPARSTQAYATLIRQRTTLRRIFAGQVPVHSILSRFLFRSSRRLVRKIQNKFLSDNTKITVPERILRLRMRGTRLIFVYSAGDLGIADFKAHLGKSPKKIARFIGGPVHIIEDVDHTLANSKAQSEIYVILSDLIARVVSEDASRTQTVDRTSSDK